MTIETGLALPGIRVEWADVVISGTSVEIRKKPQFDETRPKEHFRWEHFVPRLRFVKLIGSRAPCSGYRWHILGDPWPDNPTIRRCRCGRKLSHGSVVVDEPTDGNPTCRGCLRLNAPTRAT